MAMKYFGYGQSHGMRANGSRNLSLPRNRAYTDGQQRIRGLEIRQDANRQATERQLHD